MRIRRLEDRSAAATIEAAQAELPVQAADDRLSVGRLLVLRGAGEEERAFEDLHGVGAHAIDAVGMDALILLRDLLLGKLLDVVVFAGRSVGDDGDLLAADPLLRPPAVSEKLTPTSSGEEVGVTVTASRRVRR